METSLGGDAALNALEGTIEFTEAPTTSIDERIQQKRPFMLDWLMNATAILCGGCH